MQHLMVFLRHRLVSVVVVVIGTAIALGQDLPLDWEEVRPASYAQERLTDVVWSHGLWIAVGEAGTILTSADGRAWTPRPSGVPVDLEALASSPDRVVAVGLDGATAVAAWSANGLSWNAVAIPGVASEVIADVIWDGEQFVAAAGLIATSSDGATWTPHTPTDGYFLTDHADAHLLFWGFQFDWDMHTAVQKGTPERGWSEPVTLDCAALFSGASNGSSVAAVGFPGCLGTTAPSCAAFSSSDGVEWTRDSCEDDGPMFMDVVWKTSEFVALATVGPEIKLLRRNHEGLWEGTSIGVPCPDRYCVSAVAFQDDSAVIVGDHGWILGSGLEPTAAPGIPTAQPWGLVLAALALAAIAWRLLTAR
jgi:hypothetical protein